MTERQRYENVLKEWEDGGELLYAGRMLERAAKRWPSKIAVICQGVSLTYRDLFERALRVSAVLQAAKIVPGARVMLVYENAINFYVAYHAIWQIGAIVMPVNTLLHPHELGIIINDANPHGLVISATLRAKYKGVIGPIPLILDSEDLDRVQAAQEGPSSSLFSRDRDGTCVILYTSGTTGTPKGVMLSSNNILINCAQSDARCITRESDSFLAALPLFHSYTQNSCIWLCALLGVPAIIVPRMDRALLKEALSYNPTVIFGIPQLYALFCLMQTLSFEKVRYFMSGGDLLPNKIRMNFELIYRRKICTGYGLTEASPFISIDLDDILKAPDTVGKPFTGIECRLLTEEGQAVSADSIGVLSIKGGNVMLGYYNNLPLTQSVLKDGWLDTGDLAYFDQAGKIVLCGRAKDLIKSKGVKVYPQEIENVLLAHPRVIAAAVIGQQTESDEIPIAYVAVKKRAGAPLGPEQESSDHASIEQELKELCVSRLAPYEIPRSFIIRDRLPMTATGKVDKKALKRERQSRPYGNS